MEQFSMMFTKEEIEQFFITPLREKKKVLSIDFDSECDEIVLRTSGEDDLIGLDFELKYLKECRIGFYGFQTCLCITDALEISFYDEVMRKRITSSDTWGNVVYNGELRGKSKESILAMIVSMISLFSSAKSFTFEESQISEEYDHYPECNYTIHIFDENQISPVLHKYDNITFLIKPSEED